MKIVFMGTPEFAVSILDAIYCSEHHIVGVVTVPDKPAGRGMQMKTSVVKDYALAHQLRLEQPQNLKDPNFVQRLQEMNADVFVVVAFRMLPSVVFSIPPMGCFNLHASLLPQYRGAAPIHWAIINGETQTGLTTFMIDDHIDTGNILRQVELPIENTDTVGTLHDKMMKLGGDLVLQTLSDLSNGIILQKPQTISKETLIKSAPKLDKNNTKLNFKLSADQVLQKIKGLNPYPSAYCSIDGIGQVKIFSAQKDTQTKILNPDFAISDQKNYIKIPCKDYYIDLLDIQFPGKKRMSVKDYLRGNFFPLEILLV